MAYTINPTVFGSMFGVPSQAVDNYIKLASASQLKTMLWVCRHVSEPIDSQIIAKNIGYKPADVDDALVALCEWGILLNDEKAVTPLPKPVEKSEIKTEPQKELPEMVSVKPTYEQVVNRCKESPEIANMFTDIQQLLGKTIGYDSECILLMMHDQYGLPVEVIYMLVNYCVSIGKSGFAYIAKVGKDWGEKEIDSIEKADEQIKILNACTGAWKQFAAMAGIQNPRPTAVQSAFLRTWTIEMKFNVEMIYSAYEETIDHSGKISYHYMNKVLKSWYEKGIKTIDAVEEEKQKFRKANSGRKQTSQPSESSYDMDEFNRRANQLPVYNKKGG